MEKGAEMNVEAQDLVDILKQQAANAMYEAALNAAVAKGLHRKVEELEAKLAEAQKNG